MAESVRCQSSGPPPRCLPGLAGDEHDEASDDEEDPGA
jgi:hypothetical protein